MKAEPTYQIQLTAPQWQVVGAALSELPFRVAAPVLGEIQRQIAEIEQKQRAANEQQEAA